MTEDAAPIREKADDEIPASPRRSDRSRLLDWVLGQLYRAIPGFERVYARQLLGTKVHIERVKVGMPTWSASSNRIAIAHLSDIHLGPIVGRRSIAHLLDQVAARRPDVVCLTGDYVNHRPEEIERYEGLLDRVKPRLGTFAVLGNHDHYAGKGERIARFLESQGVQVLTNRNVTLETPAGPLQIAGLDDLHYGSPNFDDALEGTDASHPRILLSHHPDAFPEAKRRGVDLVLSGHTHGGQICLPWIGPILKHSRHGYHGGYFQEDGSHLFVSRGLGAVVLPIRFRCAAHVGWIECWPSPVRPRRPITRREQKPVAFKSL
ncbi:MAG: metallophosphoesterase [Planctomycetota bacterium]